MSTRTVNTTLLVLVCAQWLTGLGAFLTGAESLRWTLWLHAAGGCAIVVLLVWKARVIAASLRRHGAGLWALPSLLLLGLLLASLVSGLLWIITGLPSILGSSGLTWHVLISLAIIPIFAPHVWAMRPHPRPRDYLRRRTFLKRAALLAGGVALWQGVERTSDLAPPATARRRFTGSRDAGGSGNDFPRTAWLFDSAPPIDPARWEIRISGAVSSPSGVPLADLTEHTSCDAVLDCTGGWYARRVWRGPSLADVLAIAGPEAGARSIIVHSATGYSRRFPLGVARRAILARSVDGEALTAGHGAPVRLVVPGRRGYDWVKWVATIEVSRLPGWWNWPLPIR